MPDAEAELALIEAAARAAGEVALGYAPESLRRWDKPGGAGPVTEADLAVNAALEARLRAARPGHGWLSEESHDSPDRLAARRAFIVDPIDGTRAFIDGQKSWAVSVAVVEGGQPLAGVVHLPAMGRTYTAARGLGATLDGSPIACRTPGPEPDILATRAAFAPDRWPGGLPPGRRHHRPSLAWRMALVAEGRFDAMITLRPAWEWDIAAGTLICTEAGARVTDPAGHPLAFNTPSARSAGVIAAPEPLHARLMHRLKPEAD